MKFNYRSAGILVLLVHAVLLGNECVYAIKTGHKPREDVLHAAIDIARDDKIDENVRKDAIEFLRETIKMESDQLAATKRAVKWNHIESIVIFIIAHLLVALALLAAIFEFSSARKLRKKSLKASNHEIEINFEKVAIKTSSVALLYMFLALAFYFLYVKFVYPVTIVADLP